jgi:hypothetical protein
MQDTLTSAGLPSWSASKKILFRFLFALAALFMAPWQFIPVLGDWLTAQTYRLPAWIETNILHITAGTHEFTGSGDRTDDYVLAGFQLATATFACMVWTLLDRKRSDYRLLSNWLWIAVRYYLAYVLFGYGIVKVIKTQFPYPTLTQMNTPLGNFTPFRLAWLFMGYSAPYNIFTGLAEIGAALLLIPRRTVTLGALLATAVMTHVLVMNLSYDITVKLFAAQLLLLGIFLLKDDAAVLYRFFVRRQPGQLSNRKLPLTKRWQRTARIALKIIFIGYAFLLPINDTRKDYKERIDVRPPAIYGLYDITGFVRNNDTIAPLVTDTTRWTRIIFDVRRRATVFYGVAEAVRYTYDTDSVQRSIRMALPNDTAQRIAFRYERTSSVHLLLSGRWGNDSLRLLLKRNYKPNRLQSHGFHWISEYPW